MTIGRTLGRVGQAGNAANKTAMHKQAERELERYSHPVSKIAQVREIKPVDLNSPQHRKPELNSALLLDNMYKALIYWARWKSPEIATIATLWAASTWFDDLDGKLLFPAHPRLFFIGDKGSGKTRGMKIIRGMAHDPTGIVKAPVTAPGLRDALEAGRTILLDEVDRQMGAGRAHMDVQSIISAYERDTASLNGRGGANEQSLYGPMALAAKTRILTSTGGWIDDLFERSFIIETEKYTNQEDPIPDLDEQFDDIMGKIQKVMPMWSEAARPNEGLLRPIHTVPKALTARDREISSALLAVADRAVDPKLIDEQGQDLRWAIRGRTAVQNVLLGHGDNGPSIIADINKRLKALA
jgi:hypothetical protein